MPVYLLLFIAAMFSAGIAHSQATPVRVVDAAYAKCNRETYHRYLATPRANASGLALEKLNSDELVHRLSGMDSALLLSNGKAVLSLRNERDSTPSRQWLLCYFLGSGHLGTTYIYSVGNFLFESPIAWYAASKSYDMKPEHGELKNTAIASDEKQLPTLSHEFRTSERSGNH